MGGVVERGQRDGGSGRGRRFEVQTFGLQVAEVMEAILPELDPTGRAVYLPLFWRAHDHTPSCEISQEPGDPFQGRLAMCLHNRHETTNDD